MVLPRRDIAFGRILVVILVFNAFVTSDNFINWSEKNQPYLHFEYVES